MKTEVKARMAREVADKKTAIRRALLRWFRRVARDLPWRRTRSPYRIWLSEIMLQQTRVETVVPYYRRFTRAFPTVRRLAAADDDRVMKLWEGLGYYRRCRNLLEAARTLVAEHGGRIPRSAAELQRLPGVGRYTANAIASIAFGEAVAVLDGNVKRVLARLFNMSECIDDAKTIEGLWAVAEALVPPRAPGDFNQAMMELGARICTPRRPRCGECPVRRHCGAFALGRQETLPVRSRKKTVPHYQIVAAAIEKNGRFLMGKRPDGGLLGGLWEFPGGKVESGETHAGALVRELREELGIEIKPDERVAAIDHAYSHFKITLHVYRCRHVAGRPRKHHYSEIKWIARGRLRDFAMPAATIRALSRL